MKCLTCSSEMKLLFTNFYCPKCSESATESVIESVPVSVKQLPYAPFVATVYDFGDGAGPVAAHQHPNGGGWVADTASVDPQAYIGPEAQVFGTAAVRGKSYVMDKSKVYDAALVATGSMLYGNSLLYGDSFVSEGSVLINSSVTNSDVHYNSIVASSTLEGEVYVYKSKVMNAHLTSGRYYKMWPV